MRTYHIYLYSGAYAGPTRRERMIDRLALMYMFDVEPGQPILNVFYDDGKGDYHHFLKTVFRPEEEP